MKIDGSVVLLTAANGGIGRAFVQALLARGAAKIYLGARDTASVQSLLATSDRLVPPALDPTKPDQVAAAAKSAFDITLLINNAGPAAFTGTLDALEAGDDEVFPGALSQGAAQAFHADPVGMQAQMAGLVYAIA